MDAQARGRVGGGVIYGVCFSYGIQYQEGHLPADINPILQYHLYHELAIYGLPGACFFSQFKTQAQKRSAVSDLLKNSNT